MALRLLCLGQGCNLAVRFDPFFIGLNYISPAIVDSCKWDGVVLCPQRGGVGFWPQTVSDTDNGQ